MSKIHYYNEPNYTNQDHDGFMHLDMFDFYNYFKEHTSGIQAMTFALNDTTLMQATTISHGSNTFGVNAFLTYTDETFTANFVDSQNTPPLFDETFVFPLTGQRQNYWREPQSKLVSTNVDYFAMTASHMPTINDRWRVKDADWMIQIYGKRSEIYYSSYFNNDAQTMETRLSKNGSDKTTAIWHWENTVFLAKDTQLSLADKYTAASQPQSDNTVMIGAASAVAGFAITMFALTRFSKAAKAAQNEDQFMRA